MFEELWIDWKNIGPDSLLEPGEKLVNLLMANVLKIQKPVNRFAVQINWLVSSF